MSLSLRRFAVPILALLVASALLVPGFGRGMGVAFATVQGLKVNHATFSPNGDGLLDSTTVDWFNSPRPDSLVLSIWPEPRSSVNQVPLLQVTYGQPTTGGNVPSFFFAWDGRDAMGNLMPDSLYRIEVKELNAAADTVRSTASVTTRIDTTPPPEPFFDKGLDGSTTTEEEVVLTGLARSAERVYLFAGGILVDSSAVASQDASFQFERTLELGVNAFALQSVDRGRNLSVLAPAITITYRNVSDVGFLRVSPFESSPNADGLGDTVRVTVTLDAPTPRLLVDIHASVPPLTGTSVVDTLNSIDTLFDGPAVAGEYTFFWLGQDRDSNAVADGNWWAMARPDTLTLGGDPLPGKPVFSRFIVDNTAPPVPAFDAGIPTATTRNTVALTGNTPGADSVYVAKNGSVFARVTAPRWTAKGNLTLGANSFTVRGVDRAGNRSAFRAPLVVTYSEPIGFHAPERFRAGDVFDVNVTQTARAVRIDLYDLRGRRVRTLAVNQLNQRYELPWNLRDDAGNTVGDGPYVARATVTYEDGTSTVTTGAVVVAK